MSIDLPLTPRSARLSDLRRLCAITRNLSQAHHRYVDSPDPPTRKRARQVLDACRLEHRELVSKLTTSSPSASPSPPAGQEEKEKEKDSSSSNNNSYLCEFEHDVLDAARDAERTYLARERERVFSLVHARLAGSHYPTTRITRERTEAAFPVDTVESNDETLLSLPQDKIIQALECEHRQLRAELIGLRECQETIASHVRQQNTALNKVHEAAAAGGTQVESGTEALHDALAARNPDNGVYRRKPATAAVTSRNRCCNCIIM
eukprot:PhM_4_TR18904/c0_g1_i1/m.91390